MKYHNLIKLYKEGKLDDTQKKQVEEDIERQEAISEYLFDKEEFEMPDLLDRKEEDSIPEELNDKSEDFTKMIKVTIRKIFIKMGMITGLVVFLLVCFMNFALPKIVDLFYYNPAEIVGESKEEGIEGTTNRMSLDIAVFTELFLPNNYRENVEVISNGNANYDIEIEQRTSLTGVFTNVAGTINKGKMILYNPNIFSPPTANGFCPKSNVVDDHFECYGAAGTYEDALRKIENLDENNYYRAYITLDRVMCYNEFVEWEEKNNVGPEWCKICWKKKFYDESIDEAEYESTEMIGFIYRGCYEQLFYDVDKYPLLRQFDLWNTTRSEENETISEENMKQHVISMLRYMDDQKKFTKMVGVDTSDMKDKIKNIEEYGLNIYGFTVVAQKEEILKLSKLNEVDYIYTRPID